MMTNDTSQHAASWLLLPWLANGRLPANERIPVEHHVEDCAACARELALQRRMCEALAEPDRVSWAPAHRSASCSTASMATRRQRNARKPRRRVPRVSQPGCATRGGPRGLPGRPALCSRSASEESPPRRCAGRSRSTRPTPSPPIPSPASCTSPSIAPSPSARSRTSCMRPARTWSPDPTPAGYSGSRRPPRYTPDTTTGQMRALETRLRAEARVRWVEPLTAP